MNKLILTLITMMLVNHGFAEHSLKINKNGVYELKIKNKEYYLIPIEKNAFQPDPNGPNPCEGSLICYRCCTGDKTAPKEICKQTFHNWKRGKNCNC